MRTINILLILTVLGCYTGIGKYVAYIPVNVKNLTYHCHDTHDTMVGDSDFQTGKALNRDSKRSDSENGQCCLKISTKSHYSPDDRKVSFYKYPTVVTGNDNYQIAITSHAEITLVYYRPPELFISNSALLL